MLVSQDGLTADQALLMAALANGTFLMADPEEAQRIIVLRSKTLVLLDALANRDLNAAFQMATEWSREDGALSRLFLLWESLFRDIVLLSIPHSGEPTEISPNPTIIHEDIRDRLRAFGTRFPPRATAKLFERVVQARRRITERFTQKETTLAWLFMSMTPGMDPSLR